jgi:hypothetical protein
MQIVVRTINTICIIAFKTPNVLRMYLSTTFVLTMYSILLTLKKSEY